MIALGKRKYQAFYSVCHGAGAGAVSGEVLPDLRYAAAPAHPDPWQRIVGAGLLKAGGMVSFASQLAPREIGAIRDYVIYRANQTKGRRATRAY